MHVDSNVDIDVDIVNHVKVDDDVIVIDVNVGVGVSDDVGVLIFWMPGYPITERNDANKWSAIVYLPANIVMQPLEFLAARLIQFSKR